MRLIALLGKLCRMEAVPAGADQKQKPMKRTFKIAALIILLAAVGLALHRYAAIPKEEGVAHLQTKSYKQIEDHDPICHNYSIGKRDKPVELLDLPDELNGIQERVFYHRVAIGKHTVLMAAYTPEGSEKFQLWIDTNMNGRLSDERMMPGIRKSEKYQKEKHYFYDYGTFRIHAQEFASAPIHAIGNQGSFVRVCPAECKVGMIKMNNTIYHVSLADGDFDGHYSTCCSPDSNLQYPACDAIALRSRFHYESLAPMGRYYKIGDDYYRISLSADENTLRLSKEVPAMGTLKVRENIRLDSIRMYSDACSGWLKINRGEIRLPAGSYKIFYGWVTYTEPNGYEWKQMADLEADLRGGQFELTEGGVVMLNYGPPYTIRSKVSPRDSSTEATIGIDACLVGNEGEEYGLRLSASTPPPVLRILDDNGAELHAGTMEYG